jgi:hypothetical protein
VENRDKGKRKQSVDATENPAPEHYLAERIWFCWLTENPAAYLEHPQALYDFQNYDAELWEVYLKKITRRFEARLREPSDFLELSFLVRPFAGLLFGYLIVSEYEQYKQPEHTLGTYVPFIGPVHANGPQPPGQLDRKVMPRRKAYANRAKRFLPSVWPRNATGQSDGEHLKTRICGLMLDDLARAGISRRRAVQLIADMWDIRETTETDPESVRRSLLRIRPIT